MTLVLKKSEKKEEVIELSESGDSVMVTIDGENIAIFYDSGEFILHGKGTRHEYDGRWKDK